MAESKAQQILSTESRSSLLQRRWVLFSILALYLFIGVPLWFRLTEIYRAPLPANFIQTLHRNGNVDIKVTNTVYLKVGDGFRYPDLAEATQIQINHELHRLQQDPETAMSVLWNVTVQLQDEIPRDSYVLYLELGGAEGISLDETKKEATLFYTLDSVKNNDLPFFVTQTILYHMFNTEINLLSPRHDRGINALRYSPNIHLSFKLLSGDGYPVDWEIEKTLNNYFKPLVQEFRSFINFTVDSEVKYYTELNLLEGSHQINKNELSTILDFSEWDISSNQFSYPTLNFVLYYPSASQAPLEFTDQCSQYYSFLIPQWGSVLLKESALTPNTVISSQELEPLLETFTSELFKLLGIPRDPKTPKIRIDALKKYSILENLNRGIDSLSSLLKLSESLPNMSIPKTVLENVKAALESRQRVVQKLNFEYDFDGALVESISMLQHAESAFFDREMVQQTFFPQEHKIAVYMPLLGPMTLICVMGAIRVLKEIKLIRKKRD